MKIINKFDYGLCLCTENIHQSHHFTVVKKKRISINKTHLKYRGGH